MKKKYFSCKQLVKMYLEAVPETRDSYAVLTYRVWGAELRQRGREIENMDLVAVLHQVHKGVLSKMESISRARRKWQEQCPHLRGDTYRGRQDKQEEVKIDLKEWYNEY